MNWLSSTLLVLIALYFTFSQARSAKKPRIRIEILDDLLFAPGEQVKLTITLLNRPYFYARPTATEIRAYINVEATVQPLRLVFGTALSNVDKQVKVGKNKSRYLRASGIVLLAGQSESMEWYAKMPNETGDYPFWIDLVAHEGLNSTPFITTLKVHKFRRMGL
jgi:hypothetical protein